ncbi:MAG: MraY family glycosyltransferase, partial [Pirellulaceae bacterium]|nr:MraY family glycosyltransferase [Pirellulaceae bacterium]
GSLLGFLFHNRPPAKLFMGDAGAYLVGYWIAIGTSLSTYTTYHSASPHAILAPLFVMAVPLYDTITVLTIRLREGRSLYEADKSHFTHRLVDLGLTKGQSVLTAFLLTATCGLCALLLRRVGPGGAFVLALVVVCVLALINILETTARRKIRE